jgi:hypothetical protein
MGITYGSQSVGRTQPVRSSFNEARCVSRSVWSTSRKEYQEGSSMRPLSLNTMATPHQELTRQEQYRFIIGAAGSRYATVAAGLILGLPVIAYLSGSVTAMFYIQSGWPPSGSGWTSFSGTSLTPAVDASGPDTAATLIPHLSPRIMVVGESLTLGTIGSGIGLAHRLGYLAIPPVWGALGIVAVMVVTLLGKGLLVDRLLAGVVSTAFLTIHRHSDQQGRHLAGLHTMTRLRHRYQQSSTQELLSYSKSCPSPLRTEQ